MPPLEHSNLDETMVDDFHKRIMEMEDMTHFHLIEAERCSRIARGLRAANAELEARELIVHPREHDGGTPAETVFRSTGGMVHGSAQTTAARQRPA